MLSCVAYAAAGQNIPHILLHSVQETWCDRGDVGLAQGHLGFSVQFHCLAMSKGILCACLHNACFIANVVERCKTKDLCFYTSSVCN